ncbi:phosphatase PAP2 family protein [Streptomyces sp. NPDC046557]|uniref:phosphatase PAP2 family protein n=1 Tax=Streptomyces sp. NPDC046557 TaxID=3155372 RepID=UPI0033DF3A22
MATITVETGQARLAQLLSTYFSPPLLPVAAGGAVSLHLTWPHPDGLLWGLSGSGAWALLCAAMALVGARVGKWPTLTPTRRGPRLILLAASVLAGVCVLLACRSLGAPTALLTLGSMAPLLAALLLACTLATNVSLHTSAAAASVTLLALHLGTGWSVLYLLVAAIAWSRLCLGAHTHAQVLWGAALGTIACAAMVCLRR